jgi:hypothetical protein
MYEAFEISAHLFLSSLSFGECKHKVLVAIVFFMAIRHVMAVVAILQQLAFAPTLWCYDDDVCSHT